MKFRGLKSLYKNLRHGLTLMYIPHASYKKIKNCRIPFILVLIILGVIFFNIYIFIGYSTQLWRIAHFKRDIALQNEEIAKLHSEKIRVEPILEKNRSLGFKYAFSRQLNQELTNTWKRIFQKDKAQFSVASRGGSHVKIESPVYQLTTLPKTTGITTSLEKLDHNLVQLEIILNSEIEDQKRLLQELQAYERYLDHTPSIWPVYSSIRSAFGMRFHPIHREYKKHEGIDLKAATGTKVLAAADGKVSFAGWQEGYGYLIKINHDYGFETRYGHLSQLLVRSGQTVKKGQRIALSGNTGTSTGPHLHYEVRVNGNPVDPVQFLKN